jgi:uncharacterized membrane protein HdeD (DUF308 family)
MGRSTLKEAPMEADTLLKHFGTNWWLVALRGLFAVIFGILALALPAITLLALVILFGAYALADGILALIAGYKMRDSGKPVWPMVVIGILGVAAGVLTLMWPGITALVLLAFIAAWALVTGVFQIVAAIRLRKEIQHEWLLILSGVLSVLFGVAMLISPGAGALAVIWIIGAYAIVFGVMLLILGFNLRKHAGGVPAPA